jgi:hypothetical protein
MVYDDKAAHTSVQIINMISVIRLNGDTGWGGVDWIGRAQERDKWRALVKR